MCRKLILILSLVFAGFGIPEAFGESTVNYEILKKKFIGTESNNRMSYTIVVSPDITREKVKPLAEKIIKEITSKERDIDEIALWL